MIDPSQLNGPNAGYLLDLYERWLSDPASVDAATRAAFESGAPHGGPAAPGAPTPVDTAPPAITDLRRVVHAARLARMIRERGHLAAQIDPLGSAPPGDDSLDAATHELTDADLASLPAYVVGGPLADGCANSLQAIARLKDAYSGSIGFEVGHVQVAEERAWLADAIEARRFETRLGPEESLELLERLSEVEAFEVFIHRTWQGAKRFSIEGADTLVPMLDELVRHAALAGTHEVVLGMAHRGRLNVMAHVLGKPYSSILAEFQDVAEDEADGAADSNSEGWSGDVKYHLGARLAYKRSGIGEMPITLVPNPSHLEYVNPVVEGHARAAQEDRSEAGEPTQDTRRALAIAIHGDAAFPGQGVVAETLNLWNLPGYRTGGTLHIIVNNQIGFTTVPSDGRSTLYAGDLAKGFEIPILHVNADDPAACVAAARMAYAYRERFSKDFLIDLVGYRRYGHNEGDEPSYTQPTMYRTIASHPRVRELWAERLQAAGIVTDDQARKLVDDVRARLAAAKEEAGAVTLQPDAVASGSVSAEPATAVPAEVLERLNDELAMRPAGFTPSQKLETSLQRRHDNLHKAGGIDWGQAEALAYASLVADGVPIRLSGQDSERGTFSHRQAVLHDAQTGTRFVPLQAMPSADASFAIYNSPLSESAAVGFEYGFSVHAPETLVLWEAQFGDFANSAQVMLDQFLASGGAKWRQRPSLVLLLPHGYDGQGPEHSSARIERFLQLAANDNLRIVNCIQPAQFFHLLRRHAAMFSLSPRPLVVFTPKSLLRDPRVAASLGDLSSGGFRPVVTAPKPEERANRVTRLVLCTGKVHVDLTSNPAYLAAENVASARVDELYPFPTANLRDVVEKYQSLAEIMWLQEEPANMGAWTWIRSRIREDLGWSGPLLYAGRPDSASPAEGSHQRHALEQARLVQGAVDGAPAAGTTHAGRRVGRG